MMIIINRTKKMLVYRRFEEKMKKIEKKIDEIDEDQPSKNITIEN